MRVALNGMALMSPRTGIGQYTYQLAKGLQTAADLELDLFYGAGWSRQLREEVTPSVVAAKKAIKAFIPKAYSLTRLVFQQRFNGGIKRNQADIYHEPNFLAFRCSKPSVITVHDLSWIRYPHTHPVDRVRNMEKFFEPGLRRASLILTDSRFVQQELSEVFGIHPDSVLPIPLGVEPLFQPLDAEQSLPTLRSHDLVHGRYLLAVGTLEPRKNLNAVLQAFLHLPAQLRKHYPLVVVGMKGWHTDSLERQMAPLVQAGEVRQLGYLSRQELAVIIAGAATLIYPSLYEGFGLPPLEAMACRVPVITSDISSLPEVVADTGVLVNPHNVEALAQGIRSMVEDSALRERLAEKALVRSRQFSWQQCVAQTVSAYQQALARR